VIDAGFAKSNGEARRHIQGGAIRLDDQPVTDEKLVVEGSSTPLKLSMGRKKHVLLKQA
jgi:tyrosyl-tRNA synthetase